MKKSILFFLMLCSICSAKAQTQYYKGVYDGDSVSANINWKKNETLTGSYFFLSNPQKEYKITGTNFVQGEIEIIESLFGKRTASGTLYKTLKKNKVVWSGTMINTDGGNASLYLERVR